MRAWDWKWIWWQVGLPIFVPIVTSLLCVILWGSLKPNFQVRFDLIIDITPWALATYSLALIGSTLRTFWKRLIDEVFLGITMLVVALVDTIYYAFMVIRRHDPSFVVTTDAYYVTVFIVVASVGLCYRAR